MLYIKRLSTYSFIIVLLISCDHKEYSEESLCVDFIEMNSEKDFTFFKDVIVGGRRVLCKYNKKTDKIDIEFNSIDISVDDSLNAFFVFIHNEETDSATIRENFSRLQTVGYEYFSKKARIKMDENVFEEYCEFIDSFNLVYRTISTSIYYEFGNVTLSGIQKLGDFVSFNLNEASTVYYLIDSTSLNEFWSNAFQSMEKVDENWYYSIKDDEN